MRIVSIGDIGVASSGPGRDLVHIGDEAMFEALVDELGARGAQITGLSSAPDDSSARYGIDAIERIGFDLSKGREPAAQRMRDVLRVASGTARTSGMPSALPASDPAHAVVAAIADSDGVVVAGGGNLASTWPMHIFERATLAGVAAALAKPFVITGQTLGPELAGDDRALVAQMLADARLVGVREGASLALARELGVDEARLARNVDDASYVGVAGVSAGIPADGAIVVSLSTHLGTVPRVDAVSAIAELLDRTAAATGAPVLFHAHWASLDPDEVRGDTVLHEAVRGAMSTPSSTVPTTDSAASAALARRAGLQLTSRYHPAVFAASAGTPTLAISVDKYTQVKLRGALGVGEPVSIEQLVAGAAAAPALQLWNDRVALRADGAERAAAARAAASAWWDRIAAAF